MNRRCVELHINRNIATAIFVLLRFLQRTVDEYFESVYLDSSILLRFTNCPLVHRPKQTVDLTIFVLGWVCVEDSSITSFKTTCESYIIIFTFVSMGTYVILRCIIFLFSFNRSQLGVSISQWNLKQEALRSVTRNFHRKSHPVLNLSF